MEAITPNVHPHVNYGKGALGEIQLWFRVEVRDKHGRITNRPRWKKSHSFVQNFFEFIDGAWRNTTKNITDTGGVSRANQRPEQFFAAFFGNSGLVLGTDGTLPSNTDFALGSPGTGLSLSSTVVGVAQVIGSNVDLPITIAATNNTLLSIIVRELGMQVNGRDAGFAVRIWLVSHDLFSPVVTVLPAGSITVTYTWRTTV